MPVHPAGPRLYSSIPFRHLAQVGTGSGRAVNVALNVTPFVDMMTILVTFLLMVFSASGELLSAQQGLQLPNATNKDKLKQAPVIIVTRDSITFDGRQMAEVSAIESDSSMEFKISTLYDRLRQENVRFLTDGKEKLSDKERGYCDDPPPNPKPEEICLQGLLILQADRETSAKVLNRVIKTAYAAEYPNIMFAVNRRDTR
jgi:biopolymer transport protein ExbD